MSNNETGGWHWSAFFLGPFWYLSKGMTKKAIWLLLLCIFTCLLAGPFIWIYCGAVGWLEERNPTIQPVSISGMLNTFIVTPVKHRLVKSPKDHGWCGFRWYVRDGMYDPKWGAGVKMEFEPIISGE